MEQQTPDANTYYNTTRKRSFLFSRITVVFSMVILVGVLAVNVSSLYSDQTTLQSHASEKPNTNNLPPLPKGCDYKPLNNGFQVVCPSPTPETANVNAPAINVQLPQLPSSCTLQTFEGGNRVLCTTGTPITPIPTAPVVLPANCTTTAQANTVSCAVQNQKVMTPLPSLPGGCSYKQVGPNYFVTCQSSQ